MFNGLAHFLGTVLGGAANLVGHGVNNLQHNATNVVNGISQNLGPVHSYGNGNGNRIDVTPGSHYTPPNNFSRLTPQQQVSFTPFQPHTPAAIAQNNAMADPNHQYAMQQYANRFQVRPNLASPALSVQSLRPWSSGSQSLKVNSPMLNAEFPALSPFDTDTTTLSPFAPGPRPQDPQGSYLNQLYRSMR